MISYLKNNHTWMVAALLFTALTVSVSTADAQVFYQYPGATVVKDTQPSAGATFGLGDNIFRILGYARFNINEVTDLGLELVLDRADSDYPGDDASWRVGAAADVKYAIVPRTTSLPFDLAVNAGFGFESGGNVTNMNIPIGGIVSRPLELSSGKVIVPYGGLYLLITHVSVDLDPPPGVLAVDTDDTDTDVELRAGARYLMNDSYSVFGTLHVGAGTMFHLGINLNL